MIAIPNMEKPKLCNECPIGIGETMGVYYDSKSDEYKRVKITGCDEAKYHTNTLSEGYKMMYKDCPLIEIVTCGECIHRHEHEWYNTCDKHIGHGFEDDYFCKDGERNSKNNSNGI